MSVKVIDTTGSLERITGIESDGKSIMLVVLILLMRFRRRSRMPRNVTQSFKKVINLAPASAAAGITAQDLVVGVDGAAAGQASAVDANVPTGSIVKEFVIQFSCANLVSVATFCWFTVQYLLSGQSNANPQIIGGHAQRNQVLFQTLRNIGKDQNFNIQLRIKIPKKFQRVREGMRWRAVWDIDQTHTEALQAIYKFYR